MTISTAHRVAVVRQGGRYPFLARCSCGWASRGYLTPFAAQLVADEHEEKV